MTRSERFSEVVDSAHEYAKGVVNRLNEVEDDLAVYQENGDHNLEKTMFLGDVQDIVPSGKFYAPWSMHQTEEDVILDSVFFEEFGSVLQENEMRYFFNEEVPTELYVGKVISE